MEAENRDSSAGLVPRSAISLLREMLRESRAVGVIGPRQSGKTTLVRDLLGDSFEARYATLDDATTRELARADPAGFVAQLEVPAIIDEIQRVPDLVLAIKSRVDRDTRPGQFLITGSADVLTLPLIRDALPGRVEYLRLWPFTQAELRRRTAGFVDRLFTGDIHQIDGAPEGRAPYAELVAAGGYPSAYQRKAPSRSRFFDSYVESLVGTDVRELARLRDARSVAALLRVVAARSSALLNCLAMGRDLGVDPKTVDLQLGVLENLFLVRLHPAWHTNLSHREIKSPKAYVTDTGLMTALLGIDADRLVSDAQIAGSVFETFGAMELVRIVAASDDPPRVYHYRDRDGREVDAVMERANGDVAAVEVKAGATVYKRDFRGLQRLREWAGPRLRAGVVLYTGSATLPFGDRFFAAPICALWE